MIIAPRIPCIAAALLVAFAASAQAQRACSNGGMSPGGGTLTPLTTETATRAAITLQQAYGQEMARRFAMQQAYQTQQALLQQQLQQYQEEQNAAKAEAERKEASRKRKIAAREARLAETEARRAAARSKRLQAQAKTAGLARN